MKIEFESNDNLPTDKTVNIRLATIIIRSIFAQNGNYILNYFYMMHFIIYKRWYSIIKLVSQKEELM